MNTGCLSFCLYLFHFLSSLPYNFQCTTLSPPWLNLFLSIVLFEAVINGTVFLISLSDSLSSVTESQLIFVYWFCILKLYWICSNSFVMEFVGFCRYKIMLSANSNSFPSSLLIWMPFISFSCPTALARTSSIMLNKSGKSGYLLSYS